MSSNETSCFHKNKLNQAELDAYKKKFDIIATDQTFEEFVECQMKMRSRDPYASLFDSKDYELISEEQFDVTKKYPELKPYEILVTSISEKIAKQYIFRLKKLDE